ncbi:MAG: uL15m family ribosomal protein [Nanoarchaeota archaeon]
MRTARSRKKNVRQRGTVTYGFGSMKKNRGAGNRGGRGNAGSGKRGDARKPHFRVKHFRELGQFGFSNNKHRTHYSPVNIYNLENSFDTLKAKGFVKESDGYMTIDLGKLGYNKLLGTGKPTRKYQITVDFASDAAIENISKAGGLVHVANPQKAEEEAVVEE